LVTHQRDQRRDDDRNTAPDQRGQLKALGSATTGWHNRKRVLTIHDGIHDFLLARAKGVKAKNITQKRGGGQLRDPVGFLCCSFASQSHARIWFTSGLRVATQKAGTPKDAGLRNRKGNPS